MSEEMKTKILDPSHELYTGQIRHVCSGNIIFTAPDFIWDGLEQLGKDIEQVRDQADRQVAELDKRRVELMKGISIIEREPLTEEKETKRNSLLKRYFCIGTK